MRINMTQPKTRIRSAHPFAPAVIALVAIATLLCATRATPQNVSNLTRLPAYPNLIKAEMDRAFTVETLGHQCARMVATTSDSLNTVEYWYRRTLNNPSETNLTHDERFSRYDSLAGIKLALGVDYVAIYQLLGQPTTIELHRCNWLN